MNIYNDNVLTLVNLKISQNNKEDTSHQDSAITRVKIQLIY